MRVELKHREADARGPFTWDFLEWDDATLIKNTDARALFVKMFAQSLSDWAAQRQQEETFKRHAEEREVAKGEVEGEAEAKSIRFENDTGAT